MVWKTNFDRFLDDRILIPVATNHKRNDDAPVATGVVKETRPRSNAPHPVTGTENQGKEMDGVATEPTLDDILNRQMPGLHDGSDGPGMVTGTLQHVVGELSVMSQTLGLLVQRITINEDRVKKLEEELRGLKQTANDDQEH